MADLDDGWQVVRLRDESVVCATKKAEGLQSMFRPYDYDAKSRRVAGHDGRNGRIGIWDHEGKWLAALPGEALALRVGAFANAGETFFTINPAGVVRLWDLQGLG